MRKFLAFALLLNALILAHFLGRVSVNAAGGFKGDSSAGDMNCDGSTDVSDALYLLQYLFNGGPAPCQAQGDGLTDEEKEILSHLSIVYLQNTGGSGKTIRVSGVNLQVVNGTDNTDSKNGLGNVIVGYNEFRDPEEGENNRTGSHNIAVGSGQSYHSHSCLVAGLRHSALGPGASLVGGTDNRAWEGATVSGGTHNEARGFCSSISGGKENTTSPSKECQWVGGGAENQANGDYSSVSGGAGNVASGPYSSVSAGRYNHAWGIYSSVSGGGGPAPLDLSGDVPAGFGNMAISSYSSVNGGAGNIAGDTEVWERDPAVLAAAAVSGGYRNTASGPLSSVVGGYWNSAQGDYASVAGGQNNRATGDVSAILGGGGNTASEGYTCVSGGFRNQAAAPSASVSGGMDNLASGEASAVSGGRNVRVTTGWSTATGVLQLNP